MLSDKHRDFMAEAWRLAVRTGLIRAAGADGNEARAAFVRFWAMVSAQILPDLPREENNERYLHGFALGFACAILGGLLGGLIVLIAG